MLVTGNGEAEKVPPQDRGGGVLGFSGEEKEKKTGKKGLWNRE
jgi:hypothetical protein